MPCISALLVHMGAKNDGQYLNFLQ